MKGFQCNLFKLIGHIVSMGNGQSPYIKYFLEYKAIQQLNSILFHIHGLYYEGI